MEKMYNKHAMSNKKPLKDFVTAWHHSEGVFETPQGKFIARVKRKNRTNGIVYETLSQHDTRDLAQAAFDKFKRENNINS